MIVAIHRAAALLVLAQAPAAAQGSTTSSAAEFVRTAERLRPGEWVWAPAMAPAGPVLIYVDLSQQLATVYRNGVRVGVTTVSSGKPGHETPTGVFTILQKDATHHSSKYDNAPMPYQERITWSGVALHAGGLPGYPESHGCVHLPYAFSRALFAMTSLGAVVVIHGRAAGRVGRVPASTAGVLAPLDGRGRPVPVATLGGRQFSWTPERAPEGPMTIVISKSDQRVVVLRNGVEIGRSVAEVRDDDPGTHVLTLAAGPGGAPHWVYVGLPGHADEQGRGVDDAVAGRLRVPRPFYEQVRSALRPGTTILITRSNVGLAPGDPLVVLDAVAPVP